MKIALYPGSFKPTHQGHYNTAKWLLKKTNANKLIIRVGSKERDGITREDSLKIWKIYIDSDSDPLSSKIEVMASKNPSPVADVYDYVEKEAPEGSELFLGIGEKDQSEGRYDRIGKFVDPLKGIRVNQVIIPSQAGGISGTQTRELIKQNNKEGFFNNIPDFLSDEKKNQVWDIVSKKINEIGEANTKPYEYSNIKDTPNEQRFRFDTENVGYVVNIEIQEDVIDELPGKTGLVIFKTTDIDKGFTSTNKYEDLFRVMATITSIVKGLKTQGKLDHIYFDSLEEKGGKEGSKRGAEQRDKLYKAFIKKQFPKAKFIQDGSAIGIKLDEKHQWNIDKKELRVIEKLADEWFSKYGIDVTFTNHFFLRLNHGRNKPMISPEELLDLFKKAAIEYGEDISKFENGKEATLHTITNHLNLPFVIKDKSPQAEDDLELISKTIMRKKNFKSQTPKLDLKETTPFELPEEKFAEETNNDWIQESIKLINNLKYKNSYNLEDYEVKTVHLKDVIPTQKGDDYINASSKYEAEVYTKYLNNDIKVENLRKQDFFPILIDSSNNKILDGNHRHAAHKLAGFSKIKAIFLKPLKTIKEDSNSKKLRIFDFDDTLVKVDAIIPVTHPDGSKEELTPSEFAIYKPKKGDKFNFGAFEKRIDDAEPIKRNLNQLKQVINDHSVHKVTILTARLLGYPIRHYLKTKHNLDVYVVGLGSSDPMDKARWIEQQINKGYNDIMFVDDSQKNIDAASKLIKKYPNVKFNIQLAESGATMNNKEKTRHNKKLTKLRKVMKNQGDQMIPYPTNIPNTVFAVKKYLNEAMNLDEMEDYEIRFWALHADIFDKLNNQKWQTVYKKLANILKGERRAALNYFKDYIASSLESSIEENQIPENFLDEDLPQDVEDSFILKDKLNPDLWEINELGIRLKSEIQSRLLKIGQDFYDSLDLPNNVKLSDIVLTGSIANYNWSKFSDIDLHLRLDFSQLGDNEEFVRNYFMGKKGLWNQAHDIEMFGFPVEVYVENVGEPHTASGLYSVLKDDWIVVPQPKKINIDTQAIEAKVNGYLNYIEILNKYMDDGDYDNVIDLVSDIKLKLRRMRSGGLERGGEFSVENLAFKALRRMPFIGQISDMAVQAYDKKFTLNEYGIFSKEWWKSQIENM